MSQEEGESGGMPENHGLEENKQLNLDSVIDSKLAESAGTHVGNTHSNYYHDELVQMIQTEYMQSQDEGLKILLDSDPPEPHIVQEHDSRAGYEDSVHPNPQKVEERNSRAGDDDRDQPDPQEVNDHDSGARNDAKYLIGEIESLKRELLEERQTRCAAEEALKHLRAAHLEADRAGY